MLSEKQKKFLDLIIDKNETFCVSHNPYGYYSINREDLEKKEFLIEPPPPSEEQKVSGKYLKPEIITPQMINMLAINPIKGWRDDVSCTSLRNFLVEMDEGSLKKQKEYVDSIGMPYSACVFSGGKSLHFAICLDTPLPNIELYRNISRWILNVVQGADQQTINPSRSIRFPGNMRRVYGKTVVPFEERKEQKLLVIKERISHKELFNWLSQYKNKKPKVVKTNKKISETASLKKLNKWAKTELSNGVPASEGRNKTWFALSYEFCLAGYSLSDTYSILETYFAEEHDFSKREWEYTVNRGYQKCIEENG